jgi:hypothetical protein
MEIIGCSRAIQAAKKIIGWSFRGWEEKVEANDRLFGQAATTRTSGLSFSLFFLFLVFLF